MTSNKDLIAEARARVAALADAVPPTQRARILAGDVEDDRTSLLIRLANALEAHTPTRDEREALNTLYWTHPDGHTTGLSSDAIDAILASEVWRFRHTEVPEWLRKAALEEIDRREEHAEEHGHPAFQDEASTFIDEAEWAAGLRRTPTDDEQKALAEVIKGFWWECEAGAKPPKHLNGEPSAGDVALAAEILASDVWRFRRSEVPEPSAECASCQGECGGGRHCCENCVHTQPSGHDAGCEDFYPEYGAPEAGVCKVCGDRVHGEPSDAQVEAAARAIYEVRDDAFDMDAWEQLDSAQKERYVCDARAALRAAGGAR